MGLGGILSHLLYLAIKMETSRLHINNTFMVVGGRCGFVNNDSKTYELGGLRKLKSIGPEVFSAPHSLPLQDEVSLSQADCGKLVKVLDHNSDVFGMCLWARF